MACSSVGVAGERSPVAYGVGLILMGLVFVGVVCSRCHATSEHADAAAAAFMRSCSADQPAATCQALLDAGHDACFEANFMPAGSVRGAEFHGAGYERCLHIGIERHREEHRRDAMKRRAQERALGLPPR